MPERSNGLVLKTSVVQATGGSNPSSSAMSKRYSESLNQDLNNGSVRCSLRYRNIMGIKEHNTGPPISVDVFKE